MAETQATTRGKKKGSSTPVTTTPSEMGSLQNTPDAFANDDEDAKKAMRAMKREQRKAQRDPSIVIDALHKVVGVAVANSLISMTLGMVNSAKEGNTIAMKILVDLCNIVNPDAGAAGLSQGLRVTELFSAEQEAKSLLASQNTATSGLAEARIDVAPNVGPNVGIDPVLTGKTE